MLFFFFLMPCLKGFYVKSSINIREYRNLSCCRIYWNPVLKNWNEFKRFVFATTCEDPGQPENGWRVGNNFGNGSVVTFGCNSSSYVLFEASNITCNEGKWSGKTPSCVGWSNMWMMVNSCHIRRKEMSLQKQIIIQLTNYLKWKIIHFVAKLAKAFRGYEHWKGAKSFIEFQTALKSGKPKLMEWVRRLWKT